MQSKLKNTLRILAYFLSWLIFPPIYLWMLAKNKEINKSAKVWGYLSAILSPVSLLFIFVFGFMIITYKPSKFSISKLEDSIGLSLPRGYKVNINKMTHSFQDYSAEVEIEFEENELQELIREIENSPFYNLQYNFI